MIIDVCTVGMLQLAACFCMHLSTVDKLQGNQGCSLKQRNVVKLVGRESLPGVLASGCWID